MLQRKTLTKEQGLQKLRQYCAYQERCHSEVRDKLFKLGVWRKDHDEIISTLIEDNYLNEERFAIQFAGGKFRVKNWGKTKITYELKQKGISKYCIARALNQIEDKTYESTLKRLAEKKYRSLKGDQWMIRKKKTSDYLLQKGYELNLIQAALTELSQ
jgi:regulatory protein